MISKECRVIHKKVGHFKCGVLIAECGIQNTKSRMKQSAKGKAHSVKLKVKSSKEDRSLNEGII